MRKNCLILCGSIAGAFLLVAAAHARSHVDGARALKFGKGTMLFSPQDDPVHNGVVLVRGGEFLAIGPKGKTEPGAGAQIFDCAGVTVSAGRWNVQPSTIARQEIESPSRADAGVAPPGRKGLKAAPAGKFRHPALESPLDEDSLLAAASPETLALRSTSGSSHDSQQIAVSSRSLVIARRGVNGQKKMIVWSDGAVQRIYIR